MESRTTKREDVPREGAPHRSEPPKARKTAREHAQPIVARRKSTDATLKTGQEVLEQGDSRHVEREIADLKKMIVALTEASGGARGGGAGGGGAGGRSRSAQRERSRGRDSPSPPLRRTATGKLEDVRGESRRNESRRRNGVQDYSRDRPPSRGAVTDSARHVRSRSRTRGGGDLDA